MKNGAPTKAVSTPTRNSGRLDDDPGKGVGHDHEHCPGYRAERESAHGDPGPTAPAGCGVSPVPRRAIVPLTATAAPVARAAAASSVKRVRPTRTPQGARFVVAQHQQIDVASPQQDHSRGHDDEWSRDLDVIPGSRIETTGEPEQNLAQRFVVGKEDDDRGDHGSQEMR